jgi:hypothetical protein
VFIDNKIDQGKSNGEERTSPVKTRHVLEQIFVNFRIGSRVCHEDLAELTFDNPIIRKTIDP